jgi:hypothetical protein
MMMKYAERIASPPGHPRNYLFREFVSFEAHVNAADANPAADDSVASGMISNQPETTLIYQILLETALRSNQNVTLPHGPSVRATRNPVSAKRTSSGRVTTATSR